MGHVVQELAFGRWQQPVAGADFILDLGEPHGRGDWLAWLVVRADGFALTFEQGGVAQVLRFIAKHFAGLGVPQWNGVAEDPVLLRLGGIGLDQGRITTAEHIGAVAAGHEHALVRSCHYVRSLCERGLVHDQRLGQEGLDDVRRQRRYREVAKAVAARLGRQADGAAFARRRGRGQACIAIPFLEVQHLAGVDEVWVGDRAHIHAPELGPAPGAAQIQARDAP